MSQLENLLQQCTVKITIPDRMGWGTGFFVAPEWILTCSHVVREVGQPVQVRWQKRELEAVVERSLPDPYDLALLRVTLPIDASPPCVYLDEEIRSRDPLYLFGYPDQDFPNGCPVTFYCEGLTGDEPALIKFALGQVRPGMSGSPLLNQRTGKVCGIVKFTRDRSIDLGGGAIPASVILSQFPQLVELQQQFHRQDQRWSRSTAALLDTIPENLPRSGVIEFVGRSKAMEQLDQMLQQGDSLQDGKANRVVVSAIAGMGGMGKTELALQYALAYRQQYPAGICWLQARGVEVGTQLVRFAQSHLSLNPPDTLELLDQVKYCWRNWRSGDALLIFDDVTDYEAIEPYLPPATEARFKVLLTTRLWLGKSVNQLELDVLDEAAALALLQSLVGDERIQAELNQAKLLCEQLGFLPLGLELVGRYLAHKADLSVAELWKRLERQHLAARALYQTDADMTAKLGVAAAFQLSWEMLSVGAQQLGCGLSLFATAPIPWFLVEQCFENCDPEDLEESRDGELLNLHLLQRVTTATYRLHPLIREFFEAQLEQYQEADALKRQFCHVMAIAAKQVPQKLTREQILTIAPLIPHFAKTTTTLKDWLSNEELTAPYEALGMFHCDQGAYAEAEPWWEQGLSVSRSRLGEEHPDVATSLYNLAWLYYCQGRYAGAESLYIQALELRRHILGEQHPDVAYSFNGLAILYASQGRYAEAEPLYVQALELRRRILGEKHPDVARSLNNLAILYVSQERYAEAEPLYQQALTLLRCLLGEKHPDVAISLNNLATLYHLQGRYSEAESLFVQALTLKRRRIPEEKHPDIAQSLHGLAVLYREQGRYFEAEPLFQRAIEIWEQTLGDTHPELGRGLDNLGMLYAAQGQNQVAESSYLEALKILESRLGTEHPWTVQCRKNLERLRDKIGDEI